MAVGVFDFHRQLRKGLAEFRNEHDRVKAKAVAAHRLMGNDARHPPAGDQGLGVHLGSHRDQGAHQRRAAVGDVGHLLQQGLDVVAVALGIAKLRGIKRGVHARQAAKGVHAQAGIVCQRRQAAETGCVTGLGERVFHKGAKRLIRLGDVQVSLAHQLHAERREHGLQFGELAGVVGG